MDGPRSCWRSEDGFRLHRLIDPETTPADSFCARSRICGAGRDWRRAERGRSVSSHERDVRLQALLGYFPARETALDSLPVPSEATTALGRNGGWGEGCGADNSWQQIRSMLRCMSA